MSYLENIGWVDDYLHQIQPFIFIREDDQLLIKIPNEAYKLNSQGVRILQHFFQGGNVQQIIEAYDNPEKVARDIHYFFCDLKLLLKGCFREKCEYRGIEKINFGLQFQKLPVLSEVALTYRCNLRCRFCYASCGCRRSDQEYEMNTQEVFKVLERIRYEAQVPSVSFTGGEPVLRKDLLDIVRHAKSLSMWTNLITNGSRITPELADALKEEGLDSAQVSLEAGTPELHDDIVQHQGAFRKTLDGLYALKSAGIRVHTNTTISAMNKDCLADILNIVKQSGLDKLSMNLLMPAGSSLQSLDQLLVSYSEIGDIVLRIKELAESMQLEFMWYSPTPICLFNPIIHGLGNKACAACDGLLSIAPNGDVLPCSSYPESVGNLLDQNVSFEDLWHSEKVLYFQQKAFAHEKCQQCEHLTVCQGGCPLYWQHVGYHEILEDDYVLVS
ncbi:radical SAM protein [bacterium]|nr:radical SAM protein [bacterium]